MYFYLNFFRFTPTTPTDLVNHLTGLPTPVFFLQDTITLFFFNLLDVYLGFVDNKLMSSIKNTSPVFLELFSVHNETNLLIYSSILLDFFYNFNNIILLNFNLDQTLQSVFNTYHIGNYVCEEFFYKTLSISFFKNQVITYNSSLFFFILLMFFYFFLIWSFIFLGDGFSGGAQSEKKLDNYNTSISYLVESEKELGSADDMFIGICILICTYGWFFFGTIFFNFFSGVNLYYVYIGFPLFLFSVLSMPSNMLWNYGVVFPVFLRGAGNTTIFFLEFMYDILATTIMYIRLIVQNVRFLLMFFAFFECYEFFFNYIFIIKTNYFFNFTFYLNSDFFSLVLHFLNFIVFFIYNIFHLLYTIVSHFFAYLILVFWFFSFLYTTFLSEKLEYYFKKLKQ